MLLQVVDGVLQREDVGHENVVGQLVLVDQVVVRAESSGSDTDEETDKAASKGTDSLRRSWDSSGVRARGQLASQSDHSWWFFFDRGKQAR